MQDREKSEVRQDGYQNLFNKYGTKEDVSEQYRFKSGDPVTDLELTINYEENGLFTRIIDLPADEAASGGFSFDLNNEELKVFLNDSLDELDFEEKAAIAIKWSRLYGGALIVMVIDDGGGLEDPVCWDHIQGIDELLVFERPLITPDYNSIYQYKPNKRLSSKFGLPEFYEISPVYGSSFRVHESRCLIFRNGILPSVSMMSEYRFFGIPEYIRIQKALQETVTSHGSGVKLLDRAVQAIYKMKNLASLLETDEGEDSVIRRLRIIDMAKGFINSIAIDADGEDYDYKTVGFSGVKDIIDASCNMLSAVTSIPQTKLFGRSPAGENSTGEGDMENYYKFVGKIQKLNLKNNLKTLVDIILLVGRAKGQYTEIPKYTLKFSPLWSLSDKEQVDVRKIEADTEYVKAQTAQVYVDMQALDASEVRNGLAGSGEFTINDILDEDDLDWEGEDFSGQEGESVRESEETINTALSAVQPPKEDPEQIKMDSIIPSGCGVLVIKDGKILVGKRKDNGLLCGPGGHIESGETPQEAAIRETREEFGIHIAELIPLSVISDMSAQYYPSQIFLCTEFYGSPIAFNTEMEEARFEDMKDIMKQDLFLPFKRSIQELIKQLQPYHVDDTEGKWITTKSGKHVQIGENGELLKGHPAAIGGGNKITNQQKKASKKEKTLISSEKGSNIVSATGANSLMVKGFKNKQHLNNHWQNGRTHQKEYEKDGITTKEQYEKRAVELAEMPVGNGIRGYKTKEGYICRYDVAKNDYVKADVVKGIRTMFKPEDGQEYFEKMLGEEGIEND